MTEVPPSDDSAPAAGGEADTSGDQAAQVGVDRDPPPVDIEGATAAGDANATQVAGKEANATGDTNATQVANKGTDTSPPESSLRPGVFSPEERARLDAAGMTTAALNTDDAQVAGKGTDESSLRPGVFSPEQRARLDAAGMTTAALDTDDSQVADKGTDAAAGEVRDGSRLDAFRTNPERYMAAALTANLPPGFWSERNQERLKTSVESMGDLAAGGDSVSQWVSAGKLVIEFYPELAAQLWRKSTK